MAEVRIQEPARGTEPGARTVLIDAHVHCHPSFDLGEFLDRAQRNLARNAEILGCSAEAVGLLALTEGRGERSFDRFLRRSGETLPNGWQIDKTMEQGSLVARRENGLPLALIAGQQIRLRKGLELLAIGSNPALPDGGTLAVMVAAIRKAGALPVLPWGFGKWWLRRGRLVERLLAETPPDELLLADSGTRAALAPYPKLLAKAERLGFRVIAGSDPLPLPGEIARPGSFGCLLQGPFPIDTPAAGLRTLLTAAQSEPRIFGTGRPLASFVRDQLAMQLRKIRT